MAVRSCSRRLHNVDIRSENSRRSPMLMTRRHYYCYYCMLLLVILMVCTSLPNVMIHGFSSTTVTSGRMFVSYDFDIHSLYRRPYTLPELKGQRKKPTSSSSSSTINSFYRKHSNEQRYTNGVHSLLYNSATSSVMGDDNDDAGGVESYSSNNGSTGSNNSMFRGKLLALYKFTRPHTIRGTILASICGTIRALRDTPYWWTIGGNVAGTASTGVGGIPAIATILRSMLPRAMIGMIALLFGNAFIVGINQIYDQSIDKMNKPFLPIVSGEMNTRTAWSIVALSAIVGPILVYRYFPTILFQLYSFGLFLGFIYSVPPFRTKQNPILAGLTIACVRGLLLNFGIYYAVKDTFVRGSFTWSPHVSFMARFMTIFATIIAVTKDLPDIEGDKANQIETFVTKFGIANIAKGASGLLFCNYIHAIITGIVQRTMFAPIPMIGGHAILAFILIYRYRQLQPNSMASVKRFYKHIWDLFYLEYGLYTLI